MAKEEEEVAASEIERRMARAGVPVDIEQAAKLAAFVGLLLRWNRVHNLTGVRGAAELVDRHLVVRVADVGSGGGLPGLPLAITQPGCQFTLIESRAKRVHFLRHAIAELGLRNSDVAHGRAEHLRVEQPFATVLARAVAPPSELLSICRPLTAPGSILLLLTAPHLNDEFRGLAADFVLRPASTAGPKLKSAIVVLERVEV